MTQIENLSVIVTACVWQSDGHKTEAVRTINELVGEFGEMCVVDAIFDSRLANTISQIGGDQMRFARMALAEICQSRNMGLTADLLALALGMGASSGVTLTEIGRRHGVTKQAASHALQVIVARMDLPRCYCQLCEKAKKSYREQNKRQS